MYFRSFKQCYLNVVSDLAIAGIVSGNTIEGDNTEDQFWNVKALLHEQMVAFVEVTNTSQ